MKTILTAVFLFNLSAYSYANMPKCNLPEKLSCKTTYLSYPDKNKIEETINKEADFDLIDWDEPSTAFCEALISYNHKGLYIVATLVADEEMRISITRNSDEDNLIHDNFIATSKTIGQQEFKTSLSLSPTLKSNLSAVEVVCKVLNK